MTRNDQAHHHFNRAAKTYAGAGDLQEQVARTLAGFLPDKTAPRILEIGCGTGFMTRELRKKYGNKADYIITDLAPNMVLSCKDAFNDKMSYVRMDGQKPSFPAETFDLIVSSMAIQWFDDPAKSLEDLARLLKQNGHLLYATIGPDNFPEWKESLRKNGIDGGMRDDLPRTLPGQFTEQMIYRDYKDARGFLDMLRRTGAGKPKPDYQKPSPRAFKAACDSFDGKVNWHIVYGML